MKIGVNARRLEGQRLGIGRYIEYLLKYWKDMLEPGDSMTLYLREPLNPETDEWIADSFETRVLRPRLTGLSWESLVLGPAVKGQDVLFCPSYTVPLTYKGPCVVATHSLNEVQRGTHPLWHEWVYGRIYDMSARRAMKVIVPSRSVRDDVAKHFGLSADVMETVTEGADDSFQPVEDVALLEATRREYFGDDVPYILFVGKFSQRRNIPLLIQSFAALKKRCDLPHRLLLMGPNILNLPLDKLVAELGIQDQVVITNRVFPNHADLMALYSAADLYAFPSAYEGASNTTVEAMACGLPVVAGNCSAIADIVGDGGLLVDDLSVESFSRAMQKVLLDRALWADLRAKGLEQSKGHRWSITAHQTYAIIKEAALRGGESGAAAG